MLYYFTMNMPKDEIYKEYRELFDAADELDGCIRRLLEEFNKRDLKLFDLPAYQRIFLFIITRSIKTYASILELCRRGYGQDVSTLLRSLLENLITVRYILHDRRTADDLAARFVAYKWVIFKRHLPEQEKKIRSATAQEKNDFLDKKKMIHEKVEEFKTKYRIKSDRALVSWSGITLKDMAKKVDRKLLDSYETTFRLCSRFSHPSILGDDEYLIQKDHSLTFSPLPSTIGIVPNLKSAMEFILELLYITNDLFTFRKKEMIRSIEQNIGILFAKERYQDKSLSKRPAEKPAANIRESRITFKTK